MKRMLCFLVVLCILVSLSACKFATGYPQFNFGDFEESQSIDFLTQPSWEHFRCANCAFVPNVRAINHQEYAVDFYVYSTKADALISIDKIEIRHVDKVIVSQSLDCSVVLENTEDDILEGSFRALIIPMDQVEFKDGDQVQINLYVSIYESGSTCDGILIYDGTVWQYMTAVFPA